MPEKQVILLIDDNPEDYHQIDAMLHDHSDFSLVHSQSLSEATHWLDNHHCDLILLDLEFSGAISLDHFRRLRSQYRGLPIIVLTAVTNEEVGIKAIHQGAQDYLEKGFFDKRLLRRSIRYAIERHRLEEIRSQFLSTVSHELRTPLAIVKGAANNLQDGLAGPIPASQQKIVEILGKNTDRLARLIDNILDLSRLEAGKTRVHKDKVYFPRLITECQASFLPLLEEKGLIAHFDIDPDITDIYVDSDLIAQLLMNLLSNALRFAQSEISVRAKIKNDRVEVSITDDGKGIDIADNNQIFDKFVQINRPQGGSGYKGTGLGLPICKEIIEQHDGKIWVESEVGSGCTFYCTLPLFNYQTHFIELLKNQLRDVSRSKTVALMVFEASLLDRETTDRLIQNHFEGKIRKNDWIFYHSIKRQFIVIAKIETVDSEVLGYRLSEFLATKQQTPSVHYAISACSHGEQQAIDLYQMACRQISLQTTKIPRTEEHSLLNIDPALLN